MCCRIAALLVPSLTIVCFMNHARHSPAEEASSAIGKKISDFKLPDTRGRKVRLSDFQDKKGVVVAFIGTECPINNAFMPRLVDLEREFGPRGRQFVALNSNQQDTTDRVAKHARDHGMSFPVLKDEGNRVAELFRARPTPEAFLLHSERG